MSTQNSTELGARIRSVRGDDSQEEFAKKVGISRAALANYETGRTLPKRSVLARISEVVGISNSYLLKGAVRNEYELNYVVTGKGMLNESGETQDELSMLRVMRAARPPTIAAIVEALLDDIEKNAVSREQLEAVTAQSDLACLGEILTANGEYNKGSSAAQNDAFLTELAKRAKATRP